MSNLSDQQFGEYQGQHKPTSYGALHEADQAYPDVYDHPEYYSTGEKFEAESHRAMVRARGNPDHMTWIHRAVPKDAPYPSIRPGDWVTPSKSYAKMHGESSLEGNYRIGSMRVPAKHVHLTGDYLPEAGYFPEERK